MPLNTIKPDTKTALMLARRQLPELVCDAAALEGIIFTVPEIQTLLAGITVGGHTLSDQGSAINHAEAWRCLFSMIDKGEFELTARIARTLHQVAGKEEVQAWGEFRDGEVTLTGTDYRPPEHKELPKLFEQMVNSARDIGDHHDRAIFIFLEMARAKFFYGVNKRLGRLMMNGELLSRGYPVINVPAKRKQEFNGLMLEFYNTGDPSPMGDFIRSCIDPRVVKIMSERRSQPSV